MDLKEPLFLQILDSPMLDRDQWRRDAIWKLVWSSILLPIQSAQDRRIIELTERNGDSLVKTLIQNPDLYRYMNSSNKRRT